MVYTRWQDGTHGQAIRDLAIYEKQILEGILESLYGRPGFSNLRKEGPLGVFWSLYMAIRDLAILHKAGPWRVYILRSPRRVQCPSF